MNANIVEENKYSYYMIVLKPNGKYVAVKEGEKYKFDETGEYKIILYAEDEYYNTSKSVYTILVKG